jgi:homoserine kinase
MYLFKAADNIGPALLGGFVLVRWVALITFRHIR